MSEINASFAQNTSLETGGIAMRPRPASAAKSRLPTLQTKRPEPKLPYKNLLAQLRDVHIGTRAALFTVVSTLISVSGDQGIDNFMKENAAHMNQNINRITSNDRNCRVGSNGAIKKPVFPLRTCGDFKKDSDYDATRPKGSGMIRAPMPKQPPKKTYGSTRIPRAPIVPARRASSNCPSSSGSPKVHRPSAVPRQVHTFSAPSLEEVRTLKNPSMGHLPCSARHMSSLWTSLKSKLPPENYEAIKDYCDEQEERVEKLTEQKVKSQNRIRELELENKVLRDEHKLLQEQKDKLLRDHEEKSSVANENIKQLESDINKYKESLENAQEELSLTKKRLRDLEVKNAELERALTTAAAEMAKQRNEFDQIKSGMERDALQALNKISTLKAEIESQNELRRKLEQQHEVDVRQLHNEIVDLKGNIRVMVRVRNFIQHDCGDSVSNSTVKIPNQRTIHLDSNGRTVTYEFPQVFGMKSTQDDVFKSVQDLTRSALDGYNICVMAYGQTGSGKTFTMRGGDDNNAGIIPRTVQFLLSEQKRLAHLGWRYDFSVSFMEIYKDQVFDLLSLRRDSLIPRIGTSSVQIPKLTEVNLFSDSDMDSLLRMADATRSTAATKCNEFSSRSHAIFKLIINGHNETTGENFKSELNLVDLAGSERVKESEASGERFTETTHINKSLSALQNVLRARLLKQNHIPYRDSKLTSVLQESLGKGSSKTLMIVTVAPTEKHLAETRRSLEFAIQTSTVNIGTAKRN